MSVKSFIPSIWSAELLESFKDQAIIHHVTFPVPTKGGKYIINKFSDITVKDYEGEVVYDELTTTSVEVPFDQSKYWAFQIGDVDAAQVNGDLRGPAVRSGAHGMSKKVDAHFMTKVLASSAHVVEASDWETNAYNHFVVINRNLDKKDIPSTDRIALVSWDFIAALEKDPTYKASVHHDVMWNGLQLYRVNGVQILPTNRLAENVEAMIIHKSAVAYGAQLDKMEALRLEGSFADGVRGLIHFGMTVVREECIEILKKPEMMRGGELELVSEAKQPDKPKSGRGARNTKTEK